jgi:hypothetical protein
MTNNSRREFFQKVLPESFKTNFSPAIPAEINLGKIAEYPPDGETFFPAWQLVLESLPEGIRVRSKARPNNYFEVELSRQGEIIVRQQNLWPAKAVFSVIKNERIDLET